MFDFVSVTVDVTATAPGKSFTGKLNIGVGEKGGTVEAAVEEIRRVLEFLVKDPAPATESSDGVP